MDIGIIKGIQGLCRGIPEIMENQVEEKMEIRMETTIVFRCI